MSMDCPYFIFVADIPWCTTSIVLGTTNLWMNVGLRHDLSMYTTFEQCRLKLERLGWTTTSWPSLPPATRALTSICKPKPPVSSYFRTQHEYRVSQYVHIETAWYCCLLLVTRSLEVIRCGFSHVLGCKISCYGALLSFTNIVSHHSEQMHRWYTWQL